MKKSFIFSLFILGFLGFTACGGDAGVQQLETEKAVIETKFTSMQAEITRLESEEKQLSTLAATVQDNQQVSTLMKQYKSINNSLSSAMRRYDNAVNQYNGLIESKKAGNTTQEEVDAATRALQEKLDKVTKKADMTIEELGRMKAEIETAVKEATTAG